MQSFLVSPEELTLLKPTHTWTTISNSNGELSIDAQMLRQLSEAGMTIGRQIETSAVEFVLQSTKDMQTVKKLAEKLHLANENANVEMLEKLFAAVKQMVADVQQKTENGVLLQNELQMKLANGHANGIAHQSSNGAVNGGVKYPTSKRNDRHKSAMNGSDNGLTLHDLVNVLSTAVLQCVATSMTPTASQHSGGDEHNKSMYELISQVLETHLATTTHHTEKSHDQLNGGHSPSPMLAAMAELLASPQALQALETHVNQIADEIIQISKVNLIKSTVSKNIYNDAEIVKNLCIALDHEEDMIETIRTLSENEPKLLYRIVTNLKNDLNELHDDATTVAALKRSVIAAVKESAANEMNHLLTEATATPNGREHNELNVLLIETAAMAQALGLNDINASIIAVLGRTESVKVLLRDESVMDMVQRVVVMKKMAKKDPELKQSLLTLHTNPFAARKDPNIRMLLRRSGVCTIDPQNKINIADSHEVPISLFCSDNQLAMEDFLMRHETKARGAFLIVKEGLQAVVPRESSRDVLTGKCAYTVLDEHGIRHFEPLHVFSALKMHVPSMAHRFSIYSCDWASEDAEAKSVLSTSGSALSDLVLVVDKARMQAYADEHTDSLNRRRLNEPYTNGQKVTKTLILTVKHINYIIIISDTTY